MILKHTNVISNREYLRGIRENDLPVLKKIYDESLPEVVKYVRRNSGTLDDAKDVFQEGILIIYKKVMAGSLELTTDFHVFLFIVCKRIWLKKLTKNGRKEVTIEEIEGFSIEDNIEDRLIKSRKWNLFNKKLESLAEECKQVLKMLFAGKSGKDIAKAMDYTEEYAKRKKYKCKGSLADMIKKDPEYRYLVEF